MHLGSLETHYNASYFLFKAYEFFSWHSDYPIHFDQYTLNEECKTFVVKFMPESKIVEHLHKQVK